MVLLDFQDTVDHHILYNKSKPIAIDNTDWFMSYLYARQNSLQLSE